MESFKLLPAPLLAVLLDTHSVATHFVLSAQQFVHLSLSRVSEGSLFFAVHITVVPAGYLFLSAIGMDDNISLFPICIPE